LVDEKHALDQYNNIACIARLVRGGESADITIKSMPTINNQRIGKVRFIHDGDTVDSITLTLTGEWQDLLSMDLKEAKGFGWRDLARKAGHPTIRRLAEMI